MEIIWSEFFLQSMELYDKHFYMKINDKNFLDGIVW